MKNKLKKLVAVMLACCTLCAVSVNSSADTMSISAGVINYANRGAGMNTFEARLTSVSFIGVPPGTWISGKNIQLTPYSSTSSASKIGPTLTYTALGYKSNSYYNTTTVYSPVYCGGFSTAGVTIGYVFNP